MLLTTGGRRAPKVLVYQRATLASLCPEILSWRLSGIELGVQMVRFLQVASNLASSWRMLKNNLPTIATVEASMKINASGYIIIARRPDGAPREFHRINDFRGTRPEHDVTYALGHVYNHFHRYLSLLRSMFQRSRYRRISRTLHPVELTVCELCRDVRHANVGARSLYYVLRVRGTVARWAA